MSDKQTRRSTSIRTRLLVSFLVIAIASAGALSLYFVDELEQYALRNLEARLDAETILTAALMSGVVEEAGAEGLHPGLTFELNDTLRRVGNRVTTRLRVLDWSGMALADSEGEWGVSYADRPEVQAALEGRYGREMRTLEDGRVGLHIARPVLADDGTILGVVYTSSTTFSFNSLVRDYRTQLITALVLFGMVTIISTELIARWLARPLTELERGAQAIAAGDHATRVEPRGSRETRALAEAFNTMGAEVELVVTELREEERRKTRFISDVSHELRTPLTSIRGTAETLLDTEVPPERQRRFLEIIVREAGRLARLAQDLLVLQRIEGATGELAFGRVDLARAARLAVEALSPILDDRGVRVQVDGDATFVLGDVDRLQQVVANLVDNASRVSADGDTVRVEIVQDADSVSLHVIDRGPGIGSGDEERIFERFVRADEDRARSKGGAGLGLSIVRAIAETHGGCVTASNDPSGGARFTLTLPAAP